MAPRTRLVWTRRRWVTLRKIVQAVALLVFFLLFLGGRQNAWAPALVNLPMRLDPLVMAAQALAGRVLLTGALLALFTIVLTLIFGRVWCGWICPLGTLLDIFSFRRGRGERVPPPENWRSIKYILLLLILAAAVLGNLTLLIFDPLTLLYRTLTTSLWPALDVLVASIEEFLYQIPFLAAPVANFDSLIRPAIFPVEPILTRYAILFAGVFLGIVLLNLFAPRFWCRYLCPLGGLLGVLSKGALVRRQVDGACNQCSACALVCPTGTIDPNNGYISDPAECTVCMNCVAACARNGTSFPLQLSLAGGHGYDPNRRKVLVAAGAAVAGVALLQTDAAAGPMHTYCLRPPGVDEDTFLANCIRCAECSNACPTGALQPAILEAGLEGFWTPVLVPRLGYCDYSCNACGQICPTQAIPPIALAAKREAVIGHAVIDRNRCIAWADNIDCIVCEEMCPTPEKAIYLEEAQIVGPEGLEMSVQQPHLIVELCIGCGICEFKCPVEGVAAIRVEV